LSILMYPKSCNICNKCSRFMRPSISDNASNLSPFVTHIISARGIDHETNRSFCSKGLAVMVNSRVENLDPTAVYNFTKFHSEPYDFCEEETIIKK